MSETGKDFLFKHKEFQNKFLEYIKNKIDVVVLGLPKNMDGSIGEQAHICQDFKKELETS